MKYALILGAAASALALSASAQPAAPHVMMMHHGGMDLNVDANHDGWISRAEASAAADRMFDQRDANHDGRLTPEDRPVWHDMGDHVMAMPEDGNCQTSTEDQGQGQRRVTVICRDEHADNGDRQVERRVIITRNGDDTSAHQGEHGEQHAETEVIIRQAGDAAEAPEPPEAPEAPGTPVAPRPPHAPHAPMLMMLFANSEEADTNHDGALSRDEFRAQQLRFFDASDANHDGKIRFEPPPVPPAAPAAPPAPPAPHH